MSLQIEWAPRVLDTYNELATLVAYGVQTDQFAKDEGGKRL